MTASLERCVGPGALRNEPEYALRFATARPFRHVAIDGFLSRRPRLPPSMAARNRRGDRLSKVSCGARSSAASRRSRTGRIRRLLLVFCE